MSKHTRAEYAERGDTAAAPSPSAEAVALLGRLTNEGCIQTVSVLMAAGFVHPAKVEQAARIVLGLADSSTLSAPAADVGGGSGSQVDPAHEKMRERLRQALDADTDNGESLWALVNRAANALYWRGKEIEELKASAATPKQGPPVGGFVVDGSERDELLKDYVDDYEYMGEDEAGREGCYRPNERERLLIEDAIRGWEALQ